MFGWSNYSHGIWSTDILSTECLAEATIAMAFDQQTFYQLNMLFKSTIGMSFGWQNILPTQCLVEETIPWHLVNRHFTDTIFGCDNYSHGIWSTDILPTECLVEATIAMPFGWQTFYQHNLADTSMTVIWSTDILMTQCLVEATIAISIGRPTFYWLKVWLKQL